MDMKMCSTRDSRTHLETEVECVGAVAQLEGPTARWQAARGQLQCLQAKAIRAQHWIDEEGTAVRWQAGGKPSEHSIG